MGLNDQNYSLPTEDAKLFTIGNGGASSYQSDVPDSPIGWQSYGWNNKTSGATAEGAADAASGAGANAFASGAASVAKGFGAAASSWTAANEADQMAYYGTDLVKWVDNGKYWFDPYSGQVNVSIDEYLAKMPSKTDALMDSTLTGGKMSDGSPAGNVFGGAAASGLLIAGPPDLLGAAPFLARLMGKKDRAKQFEYAYHKGGEGALKGMAIGGPIGAIVDGAVGYLKGIFGWEAAKKKDAKEKEAAREEYENQLKEWTRAREIRLDNSKRQATATRLAYASQRAKASLNNSKQKMAVGAANKRAMVMNLINDAQTRVPKATRRRMVG